jgi:hypothetical protein
MIHQEAKNHGFKGFSTVSDVFYALVRFQVMASILDSSITDGTHNMLCAYNIYSFQHLANHKPSTPVVLPSNPQIDVRFPLSPCLIHSHVKACMPWILA